VPPKPVVLRPVIAATAAPKHAVPQPEKIVAVPGVAVESVSKVAEAPKASKPEDKKWAMTGKRDPFFSPVVQAPTGSGCATGKKCLEIGQINVRGVVKSDGGFIAVVTNSLNKAYFLRENDPVFNGYVVRITGDSVVFQETVQDKLGKPMVREVVKRLFTPAV
jgi:Tfp pilus assembly protein PilP